MLFKTQLREGNVLAWLSIADARPSRPPRKRVDRSDDAFPAPATLPREACLKPVRRLKTLPFVRENGFFPGTLACEEIDSAGINYAM
ncbi:hypothetical protein [Rhizobium sp.]|uniref:hypothetical protein n=1 Tax=Rhizobium sp. TaxID=391 RepID=UPI003982CDF4